MSLKILDTYLLDSLNFMRNKESKLSPYRGKSPQLNKRRLLVDWTCLSAEEISLPKSSQHLAIVLLDRFMDSHDIALESLHFICLAALSLAAKFDCLDSKVPKLSHLVKLLDVPDSCKPAQFRQLEGMIMGHFKWNIFIPTATHYVEMLRDQILHPTDLLAGISIYDDFHEVDERLSAFVTYFLDIAMQEAILAGVEQAKIAAASIFCARNVLNISPLWPLNLERLLNLHDSKFTHYSTLLMSVYVMQDSLQSSNELNEELCTPPRKKARLTAAEETGGVSPNTDEGYVSRVSFEETPQDPGKKSH